MKCSSCQKKLELYISGNLPEDVKKDVKTHLSDCAECSKIYTALMITDKMIAQEKEIKSNPFMATRVMAHIERKQEIKTANNFGLIKILQPAFLTASIVLALFVGIYAGNSYQTTTAQNRIPEELLLMDDASMESLSFMVTE